VGKTAFVSSLYERYPDRFEIISVDSVAVYRGMDIGSAKPSSEERALIPHHLLDICDPVESYSAARFVADACSAIDGIHQRGKIAVLVGGTMLYYHALLVGLSPMPVICEDARRKTQELLAMGLSSAYEALQKHDPGLAARLSHHDSQRIQRGLEVFYASGIPLCDWQKKPRLPGLFGCKTVVIQPESRAVLHQKVQQRFDAMLAQGLVEEVQALLDRDDGVQLDASYPSMRAIGYRQVCDYLVDHGDHAHMREKSIVATRRYVKRQLTWLRTWPTEHIVVQQSPSLLCAVEQVFAR
jgi:tRNA dimethylallyltransferase